MFDLRETISLPFETFELSNPTSFAISESYIATGYLNTSVHVYSIDDGTHKMSFRDPSGSVWTLCVIGDEVLVGGGDGVLRGWNIGTR